MIKINNMGFSLQLLVVSASIYCPCFGKKVSYHQVTQAFAQEA